MSANRGHWHGISSITSSHSAQHTLLARPEMHELVCISTKAAVFLNSTTHYIISSACSSSLRWIVMGFGVTMVNAPIHGHHLRRDDYTEPTDGTPTAED
ncbi:hypothetical protein FIBSPDRAFT_1055966 [Athelia psychrophila]|uniref:Uncharacterized protein n=1 Tax=Athelia psychrophila TaxID=1759441 RepID=A0A167SVE9_9AGAM|nr:hypothetical protein FIBSPDRAFT_1055969 [Fibularhizoctonia sp. CBS 109695]KZP02285.1 hypothetical protein FIBSPDRAFT_1055966 [Fibularhizoctonia sp. CBS 109695]